VKRWNDLSVEERISRWRILSIGNTAGALVVVVFAFVVLRFPVSLILSILVIIGAADTWYLGRRIPTTGNPFIRPRRQ
jgi:xanthosine utilization system XapX-like protein